MRPRWWCSTVGSSAGLCTARAVAASTVTVCVAQPVHELHPVSFKPCWQQLQCHSGCNAVAHTMVAACLPAAAFNHNHVHHGRPRPVYSVTVNLQLLLAPLLSNGSEVFFKLIWRHLGILLCRGLTEAFSAGSGGCCSRNSCSTTVVVEQPTG